MVRTRLLPSVASKRSLSWKGMSVPQPFTEVSTRPGVPLRTLL